MRTKQVADRAGVNTETLRYYERRGLLPEPPRTGAGYRDYPDSAVRVLRFVKRAQLLGFSLAEVEDLLSLAEGGPESCDAARVLAQAHVDSIDRRIAELRRMRVALANLVDSCGLPRADRSCPLLETIQDDQEPLIEAPGS